MIKLLPFAVGLLGFPALFGADDWPQFRGPDRNGVSKETGLLKTWPANGPPLLWTFRDAGAGYSPPAIVGNRLYTMGAKDKTDYLYALDTTSGLVMLPIASTFARYTMFACGAPMMFWSASTPTP